MQFGRRAYGAHRHMTEAEKARNVARSIQGKLAEGRTWSWDEYGLADNAAQQARVVLALRPARGADEAI